MRAHLLPNDPVAAVGFLVAVLAAASSRRPRASPDTSALVAGLSA